MESSEQRPDPARDREADPIVRFQQLVAQREDLTRQLFDTWGEVTDWGGLPGSTGWSGDEWLRFVARLPRRDARRLQQLTQRLAALPATAAGYRAGSVSFEQVCVIVEHTTPLSGAALADLDRLAAATAVDRNVRGDDPDITDEVATLVRDVRRPAELRRVERRAEHGQQVRWQGDLDGGGLLWAELDGVSFSTVVTAVEGAAGPPSRERRRSAQRADGLAALARTWLGGHRPLTDDRDLDAVDARPATGLRPARASVQVVVEMAHLTGGTAGQLLRTSGRRTPWLTARAVDVLACDAELLVQVVDGTRPLAELRDRDEIPESVRRAVRARDRGCRWPGCDAPVHHTDVHHLRHRADGGTHDPDNLGLLCRRHHTRIHWTDRNDDPVWHARLDPASGALTVSRRADFTGPTTHTTLPHGRHPSALVEHHDGREAATPR